MIGEKKYFVGLNAEDDVTLLAETDYINAENIRWGTTDKGATSIIEHVGGTLALNADFEVPADAMTIGGIVDKAGRYIVYFTASRTTPVLPTLNPAVSIRLYDIASGESYLLLEDADIEGGLDFVKDSLIHSARIVNDILYWTDNTMPRRFNIGAMLKAKTGENYLNPGWNYDLTNPLPQHEIAMIRKPANYPPNIVKETDITFLNNFIGNDSFQFAWQYTYYDGEVAVLSEWSESTLLNTSSETYNYVKVIMNPAEVLPQAMRILSLVVKIASTGKSFVVKLWDRESADETSELDDFGNGGELSYDFYYNITGPFIDDVTAVKPFDSVPIHSGTLEVARNRIFLGDNTEGYDTPTSTSFQLSIPNSFEIGLTTLTKNLIEVRHRNTLLVGAGRYAYSAWYVYLTEVFPVGYYALTATEQTVTGSSSYPALPPAPASVAFTGLTFRGPNLITAVANTRPPTYFFTSEWSETPTANACDVTGINVQTFSAYLPQSLYRGGTVFFDEYMRKCGVVTNDEITISIPPRDFAFSEGYASIDWALSNAASATQIPLWAKFYAPLLTRNLRTRSFVASYDEAMKYATRDADGVYEFTQTTFVTAAVALAIDTTALTQANLGYTFTDGDQCILIADDDTIYNLPVIGVSGKYVLLKVVDVGDTSTTTFVYELYTPYKASEQEPFYAMGQVYPVVDPGTGLQTYSTLSGSFRSDAFVLSRNYNSTTYFAEVMSPNDVYFNRWDTDAGRVNIITSEGQRRKKTNVSFSNVFLPGTQVNGLSSFEALNEENLPVELQCVRKLILASKVQSEGTVMLAIGESETASMYLGETQLFDTTGNSFLAKSDNVIGQVNVLQGSYGTKNPESVTVRRGQVDWFDVSAGCFARYANNGIFPISNYGMKRVAKLFSDTYASTSSTTIEALGSRPFVFGGYDPYHDESLWAIPRLATTSPKGVLSDYDEFFDSSGDLESSEDESTTISSPIYPYDIWDRQAKTLVFKNPIEGTQWGNRWMGAFMFSPEWMLSDGKNLYSFENAILYQHNNENARNTFYDITHRSRIMFASNIEPSNIKSYKALSIEGNQTPIFTHIRSEEPYEQSSDLLAEDYKDREGFYYAGFYKDRLSPNIEGTVYDKMLKGDPIKTQALRVLLEFDCDEQPLELRFVNISFINSLGHKT